MSRGETESIHQFEAARLHRTKSGSLVLRGQLMGHAGHQQDGKVMHVAVGFLDDDVGVVAARQHQIRMGDQMRAPIRHADDEGQKR